MSALGRKVLDLAEQQGLLDGKAVGELRRQVAESKFVITPEAIAKVLVDHGHLTAFQARKLVAQALGPEPDPVEQRIAEKTKPKKKAEPEQDLTFADEAARPRPSQPPEPEEAEDIVELEPIEPANRAQPAEPELSLADEKRPPRKRSPKPPVPTPVDGSTADDFVELEPIDVSRPSRGSRWKTDPTPLNETVEMSPQDLMAPLGGASPSPSKTPAPKPPAAKTPAAKTPAAKTPAPVSEVVELEPIDDLFEGTSLGPSPSEAPLLEPISQPARPQPPARPVQPSATPPRSVPSGPAAAVGHRPIKLAPPTKNVWDSPLLLIGSGILGVMIIAFGVLLYALTRGSAAEMFGKAEEEYRSGAYTSAMTIYEKFASSYPDDPNASLARVRHGMAMLRQVTDDGKNPRLGLQTAQQVLPKIENEAKFTEARSELSTILPDIADGFATQASQTTDVAKREELAKLARQALDLVNNPAYIPASLRKEREGRIARILDKLQGAERGIEQDHELATAITAIGTAAAKGDAGAAYAAHQELLKSYPALETNSQLVAAMRSVGERERELVKVSAGGAPPLTQDHSPGSVPSVLAFREGTPPADSGQSVFILAEGGIYGLDAGSGRVLWRRFVGYETTSQPVAFTEGRATDALLIDGRREEVVRISGKTGDLVWRLPLGERAFGPVVVGSRVVVTTRKGRILSIEAATGKVLHTAQLPQQASIAIASQPRGRSDSADAAGKLYQLGDHSTLFVLDGSSLACLQTVYLGHKAGTILVPPVAVLDHLIVIESPGDDYSTLRVLAPDAKSKRLVILGRPQRLKGRVINPPSTSGARLAAITDLGQTALYTVDAASEPDHLRLLAGLDASEASPLPAYCEVDQNRLWVAMRRRTMFEVQPALGQLARRFTENEDDTFVGPPQLHGDMQVLVRRRKGGSGVVVEGRRAGSSESLWTTHLASPIAALTGSEARGMAHALTAGGRLFTWNADDTAARVLGKPAFTPPGGGGAPIFREVSISPETQQLVWTERSEKGHVFQLDLSAGGAPTSLTLPGRAAAPAIPLGKGFVAPLVEGSIAFLAADSAEPRAAPFVPPLVPDALPKWSMPVPLADQATCLVSDGRSIVYALARKDQPRPQLARVGESQPGAPLVSPLARAGSTVIGIVRQEASDAIMGFDNRAAAAFEPIPLKGRYEAGPFAVGGLVLIAAEPDGLVCCGADGKIRWTIPREHGPLAGPPIANSDGDLVIAFQAGTVCLLDAASGKELASHEIGEPLSGSMQILKSGLLLAGSDGVVHRIDAPRRP